MAWCGLSKLLRACLLLASAFAPASLLGRDVPREDPVAQALSRAARRAFPAVVSVVTPGKGPQAGVVISPDGLILTSARLLPERGSIWVYDEDGRRSVETRPLGRDLNKDLLLLQPLQKRGEVSVDRFPAHLAFDGSFRPRPGRFLAAVGPRKGKAHLLSRGIVSAVGRDAGLTGDPSSVQFDAPVNHAMRGAAVIDLRGALVGIVTNVDEDGKAGINSRVSFFVPAPAILEVLDELRKGRTIPRRLKSPTDPESPFLGVQFSFEPDPAGGIRVESIVPGSAADRAGLRAGDIIERLDGALLQDGVSLGERIRSKDVGETVRIVGRRADGSFEITAVLGRRGTIR